MFAAIVERLRQKYRTVPYPKAPPVLPERFKGKPHIAAQNCAHCQGGKCAACIEICPSGALALRNNGELSLDLGLCIFCGRCAETCPGSAITFSKEYRLASTSREELLIQASQGSPDEIQPNAVVPLSGKIAPYFKRSLRLREVSAAGCNACDADCNVLGTIVFDLPRFGIDFVASPRHADAMLVTGPVPRNMQLAMRKCHAVMPPPKIVVAVGACAISGGLFKDLKEDAKGVPPHFAVDLFIPGCPPSPYTILDGLLRFIGKI